MSYKSSLLISVFLVSAIIMPCEGRADPANPVEIARMQFSHQKIQGVVTDVRSGPFTVKTSTGTNYTLAESVAIRHAREVPRVGDEMILSINAGNHIMGAKKKGVHTEEPYYVSGGLISINYGKSQMTLSTSEGEKSYKLRPESRMFRDIVVGTPMTVAVDEVGEVIDLRADSSADAPRTGFNYPDNGSALKGFRHLGKPE